MASVRIEDEAFSDARYLILAARAGLADADHARGKMALLWRQCTMAGTYVLDEDFVTAVLGPNGVTALVKAHLGEETPDGIRIRGTEGRIEWLERIRENGRKGGRKSAEANKRAASGSAPGAATGSVQAANIEPESNPLTLALALAPQNQKEPPLPPKGVDRARPARPPRGFTAEQRAVAAKVLGYFTKRSGAAYQGADPHVRLITARLAERLTVHDLQCVVAYAWEETGLGWSTGTNAAGKPMAAWFTPETLFGPNKIHQYLEPARKWFREVVEPTLSDRQKLSSAPPLTVAADPSMPNVLPLRSAR